MPDPPGWSTGATVSGPTPALDVAVRSPTPGNPYPRRDEAVNMLQTGLFSDSERCRLAGMHRLIDRLRTRRRERDLARELEMRARAQLDARAEAAARMGDDPRRG